MPMSRSRSATSRPFKEVRPKAKELKVELTLTLTKLRVVPKVRVMHGGKLANVNLILAHLSTPTILIRKAGLLVLDAKVAAKVGGKARARIEHAGSTEGQGQRLSRATVGSSIVASLSRCLRLWLRLLYLLLSRRRLRFLCSRQLNVSTHRPHRLQRPTCRTAQWQLTHLRRRRHRCLSYR